jgi:branched-chain amino acid transport system substrate-binding protein
VRARWLCLAALAAGATGAAGCGGTGATGASETAGNQLAVYSSLPLQGPSVSISMQIVDGEKLALAQAGGRVGPFRVSYVSLDDSNPATGKWSPDLTATDAKVAAQDTSTIAYLGEYNSAATAISLPLINAAGILQVSPSSPYVGLISSLDAGQDEPGRFYLSGRRNFVRLAPGDTAEAAAQVRLMKDLGVSQVYLLDDQNPFEVPLARILAVDAERAGIRVAGHDSLTVAPGSSFTGEVEKIVESGAQAVFLAGGTGAGTVTLFRQLHSANPRLQLLGPSTMVNDSFASEIGAAASSTFLTTPVLALRLYPPSAQRVVSDFRRSFPGVEAGPYALYGYQAMSTVLQAIRAAGSRGNDRQAVVERFFSATHPDSVLGPYSIEGDGETTLSQYGVDRILNGKPVFYRAVSVR